MPTTTKTRPRKTLDDYLALPDDVRAELIDGELYMTPAPTPRHQVVIGRLHVALHAFVHEHGLGEIYLSPVDVVLPAGDVVQPDLVYVATANAGIVGNLIDGVPDLCIEVCSPSNAERDRIVKHRLYASAGVPEYWIVDPEQSGVEVLSLADGAWKPSGWFTGDATLRSPLLDGLALPVAPLFAS